MNLKPKLICSAAILAGAVAALGAVGSKSEIPSVPEGLLGSLISAQGSAKVGLYSIPVTPDSPRQLIFEGPQANFGGVALDGVYYCNKSWSWLGMFTFYEVFAYDLSTGEELFMYDEDDVAAYFSCGGMGADPVTGSAIGIFYDAELRNPALAVVSYDGGTPHKDILAALPEDAPGICAFSVDAGGNCHVLGMDGVIYDIDRTAGHFTPKGNTGLHPSQTGCGAIDDATGIMWCYVESEDSSPSLVGVDLSTASVTSTISYADQTKYGGICYQRPAALPEAPGACSDISAEFEGSNLQGVISCTSPATLFNGSSPQGSLTIHVLANGLPVASADCAWSERVSLPVDLAESGAGIYEFIVYASNAVGIGPKERLSGIWIGTATPADPEDVKLEKTGNQLLLTWEPVSSAAEGGYLDADAITYTVTRPDGTLLASDLKECSFSETIGESQIPVSHQYGVRAVLPGAESAVVLSNTIVTGENQVPWRSDFFNGLLQGYTVIDANNDGILWTTEGNAAVIKYNEDMPMDDWLMAPPVALEQDMAYPVSCTIYAESQYIPERIEIKFGDDNSPEAMQGTLLDAVQISNESSDPLRVSGYMIPTASGRWFIGFHGISDADRFLLYVSDISIGEPVSAHVPASVSGLTVTPAPGASSNASISFMAPAVDLAGNPLSSLTKIEVICGTRIVKTLENPAAGSSFSVTDDVSQNGNVTYSVVAYNEYGAGAVASASAYIGFDNPEAPGSAVAVRTQQEGFVTLSWDPVYADVKGNAFPAGSVTYDIYGTDPENPVATGVQGTEYTFRAVPEGEQVMLSCAVKARFNDLLSTPTTAPSIPVGTPYPGLKETGPFGSYIWGLSSAGGAEWSIVRDGDVEGFPESLDGDGWYFACVGSEVADFGVLFSGLISLSDMASPGIRFSTYDFCGEGGSLDRNRITVSVKRASEGNWVDLTSRVVHDMCPEQSEWGTSTVPLADFAGEVVQIQFMATTQTYMMTAIDGIYVGNIEKENLAITSCAAPSIVACGSEFDVSLTVDNLGTSVSREASVELYAGNDLVERITLDPLASGASVPLTFTCHMSPIAVAPVEYCAIVLMDGDGNPLDNTSKTMIVTPRQSVLPSPVGLTGEQAGRAVRLSWSSPSMTAEAVTDDFENAESFADHYGDWIFVDADGSPVGGMQNTDIPGIVSGVTMGSFWVWDTDLLPIGNSGNAHSGSHYLFSLYRRDGGKSDEWALSPELSGEEQSISFWAKSYSASYNESFMIYWSDGSTDLEAFSVVKGSAVRAVPGEWTEYSFVIPQGARRFAIRCVSDNAFMFMVDDVTYIPASERLSALSGYRVYRNGEFIGTTSADVLSYIDTNVENGEEYSYAVTALYGSEEGAPAFATVFVDFSGIVESEQSSVCVDAGKGSIHAEGYASLLRVFAIDGMQVFTGDLEGVLEIPVAPGVYIVTTGGSSTLLKVD